MSSSFPLDNPVLEIDPAFYFNGIEFGFSFYYRGLDSDDNCEWDVPCLSNFGAIFLWEFQEIESLFIQKSSINTHFVSLCFLLTLIEVQYYIRSGCTA